MHLLKIQRFGCARMNKTEEAEFGAGGDQTHGGALPMIDSDVLEMRSWVRLVKCGIPQPQVPSVPPNTNGNDGGDTPEWECVG